MKKLLSILLTLVSFAGYAQMNTFGGIGLRVNDTTTYQTNAAAYHSAGYRDMYFNNQATNKHWDIWNGTTYEHVFRFATIYPDGQTYTTNHLLVESDVKNGEGQIIMNNASAATVTLSPDATTDFPDWTTISITQGLADSVTLSHPGVTINKCATCKEYTRGRMTVMLLQKTDIADTWNLYGTADTGSGGGGGSTVTPSALTRTNDTNVTITLGGSPTTALLDATSLTMGWSGQLAGTRGGSGVSNAGNLTWGANNLTFTTSGSTSVTLPTSGTLGTLAGTETLSNKRLTPRIQAVTSSATVTPNADTDDLVKVTAQAAGITFANPSGTPTGGQALLIRLKDNGTARGITWGSQYRGIGISLPTTTVISKTLYFGLVWNADDSKWDVVGYSIEL